MIVSRSMVADGSGCDGSSDGLDALLEIEKATTKKASTKEPADSTTKEPRDSTTLRINRGDAPLNDYSENGMLLSGGFWWLFILQAPWLSNQPLDPGGVDYLLLQYNCMCAQDIDFVMMIDSQRRRSESARAVAARVKCTPQAWRQFRHHVEDPMWPQKLVEAKENPSGKEAQDVKRAALGFLQLCGKTVKWSAAERAACKSELYALSRRFGVASTFWTIAFDDVHDTTVMRLSMASTCNDAFPAEANGLQDQMWVAMNAGKQVVTLEGLSGAESVELPISEEFLQELATKNPVATCALITASHKNRRSPSAT